MLKKIKTSLLEIAYEERGDASGAPVILMHGFPDDVRTWDAITNELADKGFRALAVYTRGCGETRFLDKSTMRSGEGASLAGSSEGQEKYFTGFYERRALDGIGHFIPREQPEAVVRAVLKLAEAKV